jgi:GAF domain-containing protein/CheY-like chemotaxis protein
LAEFFDEVVILMAEALGLECSQILELPPGGRSMLLRAGTGWQDGLVGQAIVDANRKTQAGFTLHTGSLVTVDGLGAETRFRETPFLREHGIVSGITVVIGHEGRPFGVLGAHSRSPRAFTEDDVHFVQAIANLLAATVERSVMEKALGESKEAAERASAAKSEFLSRMSHELRTPLNAIVGFGQLLERVGRDSEDADNVRQILEAGRHLLGLVNEMFDLSDMETAALTIESLRVSEAAGEAMAGPLAEERAAPPGANRLGAPLNESAFSAIRDPQSEIHPPGTLLYIEENLSHLRLITRILARRPSIQFLSAATSPRGLEIAREHRPDLILLDLHTLDNEGDQALAQLLADPRTSDVPVVVLSADDLPEKRAQMLAAGARAFLAKPVVVRTLLGVVDQFIKERA